MLLEIYRQPLWSIVLTMLFCVGIWSVLGVACARRRPVFWQRFHLALLLISLGLVFYATILSRSQGTRELILRPFQSFREAAEQPEMYRTMLMNVFLFFPFGLSLSGIQPGKWKPWQRLLTAAACGLLLSVLVEGAQYFFCLGRAEADDVLCNTFGTALGASTVIWQALLGKIRVN